MALTIDNASIGYNSEGLGTCLDNIHTNVIQAAIDKMKDSQDKIQEWIDSAWVGHSADAFKNNFFVQELRIVKGLQDAETALRAEFYQIMTELAHADSELIQKDGLFDGF